MEFLSIPNLAASACAEEWCCRLVRFACAVNLQFLVVHWVPNVGPLFLFFCFALGLILNVHCVRRIRVWRRSVDGLRGYSSNAGRCSARSINKKMIDCGGPGCPSSPRNVCWPMIWSWIARCFVCWRRSLAVVESGTMFGGIEGPVALRGDHLSRAVGGVGIRFLG